MEVLSESLWLSSEERQSYQGLTSGTCPEDFTRGLPWARHRDQALSAEAEALALNPEDDESHGADFEGKEGLKLDCLGSRVNREYAYLTRLP